MDQAQNLAEKVKAAHPPATNYTRSFKDTLDHILYNRGAVEVLELLETPDDETLSKEEALPSAVFPSDHLRIQAKFKLHFGPTQS
jgi:mRNA deadenylase 3'-5' endonuclease subunit Ccr4